MWVQLLPIHPFPVHFRPDNVGDANLKQQFDLLHCQLSMRNMESELQHDRRAPTRHCQQFVDLLDYGNQQIQDRNQQIQHLNTEVCQLEEILAEKACQQQIIQRRHGLLMRALQDQSRHHEVCQAL